MTEISTIIRARLDEGRAIADEDVRALLNENEKLRNDALEEVVVLLEDIVVKTIEGEYEARIPRCVVTLSDCLAKIRELKGEGNE